MGKSIAKFDDYMTALKKELNKNNNSHLYSDGNEEELQSMTIHQNRKPMIK